MKKLTTAALIAALGVSANVMAADWFVGGSIGAGFNDQSVSGTNLRKADDPIRYGLHVGAYLNDNMRVYGSYNTGKDDAKRNGVKTEMTQEQFLLSADYLFGTGALKPFAGLTIGHDNTEFKVSGENGFKKDKGNIAMGGQVGAVYALGNFDLEGGYRHLWHDTKIRANGATLKNKSDGNLYASVSYRF
ncbi:hypothetical protein GZ77_13135 [Endozoicomonas montiporae]|uniref:Outer membrane protein beta-barrel domain-containing protein n=2 Tax=Endozoicomonas montiporae TaxID=1027273 RepID=A0A081N4I2_9GAMM|nr:porin family protein [Endozoicomonas montiporae]AMO57787.1 hypothetical protein EZMO1_3845 [Endozoicomonas montiporae CL-33]KEQ13355.1 hypothetical protein GZ77_13135 [Endozoicomonas montiporae]